MATRTKTISYTSATNTTTLAAATSRDATITVYIPETVVGFDSVQVKCFTRADSATAVTMTTPVLGLKLGAAAITEVTLGAPAVNSGEHQTFLFAADLTAHFTANWTGASMSCDLRFRCAGVATINHCFELHITYRYDDTATTQIKTVRVPIESINGNLTSTLANIGVASPIPALNTWLPEASKTIRHVGLVLIGNETSAATTTQTLTTAVNGVSATAYIARQELTSSCWMMCIRDITSVDFSAARTLQASVNAGSFTQLGGYLIVTYEYNDSTSTTIMNSLLLGAIDTVGHVGGSAATDREVWERTIFVEEPGTITLEESAVVLFLNDIAGVGMNVGVGSQAGLARTLTAGSLQCGQYSMVHRVDGGGLHANGLTLARGANAYQIRVHSTTANAGWNISGFLILNYTSGKATTGSGTHAHTIMKHFLNTPIATSNIATSTSQGFNIPESDYWLIGMVSELSGTLPASAAGGLALLAELKSGEGSGDGWEPLYVGMFRTDAEAGIITCWGASRSSWKRHPDDPDAQRMDLETARFIRYNVAPTGGYAVALWATYHSHLWSVDGTVSGFTGDGSGIALDVYRVMDGEHLGSSTTAIGGTFSIPWHDNTEEVYVVAYQDNTHLGRSPNGLAE